VYGATVEVPISSEELAMYLTLLIVPPLKCEAVALNVTLVPILNVALLIGLVTLTLIGAGVGVGVGTGVGVAVGVGVGVGVGTGVGVGVAVGVGVDDGVGVGEGGGGGGLLPNIAAFN
jgi:hypothetical protein